MQEWRRRQQMSNLYSMIHHVAYGVNDGGNGEKPEPEYVDIVVKYEYFELDPEQEYGVKLFANGQEINSGTIVTAVKGMEVQLEVTVDNEFASFTMWSNGKKTSKIKFTADSSMELTARVVKIGVEENPIKVRTLTALEKLRDDVAAGDCKEGVYFKQEADIDLDGIAWDGIGLTDPTDSNTRKYDPDPNHSFKGVYDGNGKSVNNLTLHCVTDGTSGYANRYKALFRAAGYGAIIKNLTVNINGVDNWVEEDIMAAAIVGVTAGGLTIQNCTANGTLGTLDEPVDNSSGILCRCAVQDNAEVTLTNVTNNVDIVSICKTGGIIAYAYGTLNFNNVTNNGSITRKGLDATRDDAVGGLVGYGHQGGTHEYYHFNGVKNTGAITSDLTTKSYQVGQLVGKWSAMQASNTGDIVLLDNDMPLSKNIDPNIVGLNIFFGEAKPDGHIHLAKDFEDGHDYIYLFNNVNPSGTATTPNAKVLAAGTSITVDQRFGAPNITDESGTKIDGVLESGSIYRYTA